MTTPDEYRFKTRPSIEEFARHIAQSHQADEQGEATILVSWEGDEVRLVEIAERIPASEDPLPFHFAAQSARGFYFPVIILMVNRDAWQQSADKNALLPDGWKIDEFVDIKDLEEE